MAMGKFNLRLSAGLAFVLLVAACSGGAGQTTTSDATSSTAPETTTTTASTGQGEAPEMVGEYTVTHYYSPEFNGTTNLWPNTEITLSIGSDGSISGNAGCNDYMGAFSVSGPYITDAGFDEEEGQAMSISNLSWTEIACEDDLVMEQEAEFLDALLNVEQWWVGQGFGGDDNALLLLSLDRGLQVQASKAP